MRTVQVGRFNKGCQIFKNSRLFATIIAKEYNCEYGIQPTD